LQAFSIEQPELISVFGCFFMVDRVVTAISAQKRNPERVNIYLDGEFAFGLSSIVAAWLRVGETLSEQKIEELRRHDGLEVAYESALKSLNYRSRTKKEISRKLTEKGYSSDQIQAVIDRLERSGLVEDARYAQMWVENRNEFHPRSQRLMRLEMKQKGIDEEVIESALGGSADDSELAIRAAEGQLRKYERLEWPEFRQKLSSFLARRGFSYGTISPVVRSVWDSLKNHPT
jgi:regulatory protein